MNFKHYILGCSILLCFITKTLQASNVVVVEDDPTTYYLGGVNIDYYEDLNGKLIINDVSSESFDKNFEVPKKERPINRNSSTHWIRFTLENQTTDRDDWVLEFYDFRIDDIKIYIPYGNEFKILEGGDSHPFHDKQYKHKNFAFNFPLPEGTATYYVQIKAFEKAAIFAVLRSHEKFTSYAINEYFMLALFYGALISLIIFNLFLFITTGKRIYILYVLYTTSICFYALTQDGIGFQYIWADLPVLNNYMYGISLFLLIVCTILYLRAFLNIKHYFPFVDKLLRWFLYARAALLILGMFLYPPLINLKWLDIFPLIMALVLGILVWNKGYRAARYFVLGFVFLAVGLFLNILQSFIVNTDMIFVYSFNFGVICQMLLLSLAIADKISEINKQKELVEAKNRDLDVFVYKASHDIKGPLKSIIGLTTFGMHDAKPSEMKTYFEMILKNTTRLDTILADLLMITKVKQAEVQKVKINFNEMIQEILASFQYYPSFQEIDFKVSIEGSREFYSDPGLIYSIFQNLIENGIKYKKSPSSSSFEDTQQKSYLHIDINLQNGATILFKDNGVGIPKQYQSKIFDMFFRGETDVSGTGLGLYLVKMSVEKLGGKISLASVENEGSTFKIHFPF